MPSDSAAAAKFWDDVAIAPVEIALPSGVGLTLRHYRTVQVPVARPKEELDELDDEYLDDLDLEDEELDEESEEEPELVDREDVVFLAHRGTLFLFRSPEGLVEFIKSKAPHDLTTVESFARVRKECTPEFLVPAPEDSYELDLVVKNLRGGYDAWDPDLLISAAEIARDIAQACGLTDTLAALSPGSPLDDLDDALRDGGFWARRRMRRIGVDTAALAWRGVIGKISSIVEWHD